MLAWGLTAMVVMAEGIDGHGGGLMANGVSLGVFNVGRC